MKLEYGTANLDILTTYENNYIKLIRTLYEWGKQLYELDYTDKAITVLAYGIKLGTDISEHYILLGKLYKETNQIEKLKNLIIQAEDIDSLMKSKIVRELKVLC